MGISTYFDGQGLKCQAYLEMPRIQWNNGCSKNARRWYFEDGAGLGDVGILI